MRKIKMLMFLGVITTVLAFGTTAMAKKIRWRMGSTWTPAINLYYGDKQMIKYVKEMTGGDFQIKWRNILFVFAVMGEGNGVAVFFHIVNDPAHIFVNRRDVLHGPFHDGFELFGTQIGNSFGFDFHFL